MISVYKQAQTVHVDFIKIRFSEDKLKKEHSHIIQIYVHLMCVESM